MLQQDAVRLISRGDVQVFLSETATTPSDRMSLLAVQNVARSLCDAYTYVEVGSEMGGTLVPHLLDSACARAVSIDPRPDSQPDERGVRYSYEGVTTARMVEHLRSLLPAPCLGKLLTIETDASQVSEQSFPGSADLVLIDGEHTNVAVFSDFLSLFPLLAANAVIMFHDSNLVSDAIQNIERFLAFNGVAFQTFYLPDVVAAIGLRDSGPVLADRVAGMALDPLTFIGGAKVAIREDIARAVQAKAHLPTASAIIHRRDDVAPVASRPTMPTASA